MTKIVQLGIKLNFQVLEIAQIINLTSRVSANQNENLKQGTFFKHPVYLPSRETVHSEVLAEGQNLSFALFNKITRTMQQKLTS